MSDDPAMAATADGGGRGTTGRTRRAVMLPWHLVLFVAFVITYLSGTDASLVQVHLYAGCTVVALLGLRLVLGLASPAGGALALQRPGFALRRAEPRGRRGRPPVLAWLTLLLLVAVPAAAISGWGAADLHAELSNLAVGVVVVHAAVVIAIFGG